MQLGTADEKMAGAAYRIKEKDSLIVHDAYTYFLYRMCSVDIKTIRGYIFTIADFSVVHRPKQSKQAYKNYKNNS